MRPVTIHTSTLEQCFHLGKWYVYIYIESFWHHLKLLSKATNILRNRTSVYQNNFRIIFVWLQYKKNGRVDVLPYLLTHVDIILCPLVFCGRKYYLTVTIPVMEKSLCVHVCICTHYGNICSQPLDHLAFSFSWQLWAEGRTLSAWPDFS